jgi:hypothetical protein
MHCRLCYNGYWWFKTCWKRIFGCGGIVGGWGGAIEGCAWTIFAWYKVSLPPQPLGMVF